MTGLSAPGIGKPTARNDVAERAARRARTTRMPAPARAAALFQQACTVPLPVAATTNHRIRGTRLALPHQQIDQRGARACVARHDLHMTQETADIMFS